MENIHVKTFIVILTVVLAACLHGECRAAWYKGQTHCHSVWSDGNTLPELAVEWYKDHGFQFMALTDHGILQLDTNRWKEVSQTLVKNEVWQALVDEAKRKFGDDWCETKTEEGKTFVRLKTFSELAQKFDEDGKFLLVPGHEQNARIGGFALRADGSGPRTGGLVLHANAINITNTIPFPNQLPTPVEAALAWRGASLENSAKSGLDGLWTLNHPGWPYYDISPEVLIEASDIEFYECRNVSAGPAKQQALMPDAEKYWDIVNAFRILKGNKPVYGLASDDTHDYLTGGVYHTAIPGEGWIVVRSEKLDANSLIQSMKRGDFYASTDVVLKDVRFDPAAGTLTVEAQPREGLQYTIRFVGTKKGFDTTRIAFEIPAEGDLPARKGFTYSDRIGETFQTSVGNTATYKVAPDDMYVRAIVTSDRRLPYAANNKPALETAWTQPVMPTTAATPATPRITVQLTNTLGVARTQESVRVDWREVTAKFGASAQKAGRQMTGARDTGARSASTQGVSAQDVSVVDAAGNPVPSQVLYEGYAEPQGLLFQANVPAKGKAEYFIIRGGRQNYPARVFGRYVPERLDDYAWESDRIAFRIYGPALKEPLTPGIDIWCKSTDLLIVNKWYAKGDGKGGYHHNEGEGMDCFKVGATLGCGACAPLIGGKLILSGNYATWQTLDNGPLRTTVRLTYATFEATGTPVAGGAQDKAQASGSQAGRGTLVEGAKVALEKTISLDAGSHFNVTTNRYTGDFRKMPIAIGLVLHDSLVVDTSQTNSLITVAEWASDSKDPKSDGNIFMAAITPASIASKSQSVDGHLVLTFDIVPGQAFTYLTGAGWSQGGIADSAAWKALAASQASRWNNPLKIKLK